jgi:hypothetical protein
MASLLTNITDAAIKDSETELTGKTTTRPNLLRFDEADNEIYVVNVDIGEAGEMRDVAIAQGNQQLRYAEVASPVNLKKVAGHWTVVGFAKTMPGTYKRVPVTVPSFDFGLPTYTTGTVVTESFIIRALTYGELGTLSSYGAISAPYGAIGKFKEGVLVEIFT